MKLPPGVGPLSQRSRCVLDALAAVLVGQQLKEVIAVGFRMADGGKTIIVSIACNGTVQAKTNHIGI